MTLALTRNPVLAYRVLDHIEAHPELWNQRHWQCGTARCFAGWTVELSGERMVPGRSIVMVGDVPVHVGLRAARLLGYADEDEMGDVLDEAGFEGELLFSASNDLNDLKDFVAVLFGPRPKDMP